MNTSQIAEFKLTEYEDLFKECFPRARMNSEYLKWLYFSNPLGNALGYDAHVDGYLVSHYACIPMMVDGTLGLLSLNTATRARYRGRGLFKALALQTYENADNRYNFVAGVANHNSISTFTDSLGFKVIGDLNLRYGKLVHSLKDIPFWAPENLNWRIQSPRRHFDYKVLSEGLILVKVRPRGWPISLKTVVSLGEFAARELEAPTKYGLTLDWSDGNSPKVFLPKSLKPSPLIFILKELKQINLKINSWSFLNFDAF